MISRPSRHGASWSEREERTLYDLTSQGLALSDICSQLQRARGGILARQVVLGLRKERNGDLVSPLPPFAPISNRSPAKRLEQQPKLNKVPILAEQGTEKAGVNLGDPVASLWAGLEADISDFIERKARDHGTRNAQIVRARLSPSEVTHEQPTLQELGDTFGISRERVRQIEEKAVRILRTRIRGKKGYVFSVLHQYRSLHEDLSEQEYYRWFFRVLLQEKVSASFANFVLSGMGSVDGLSSIHIQALQSNYRAAVLELERSVAAENRERLRADDETGRADNFVKEVLLKSTFSGNFAASDVQLSSFPKLRPCKGAREVFSKILGRAVQWESWGERKFIESLDRSSIVREFAEQSAQVNFTHEGQNRTYFVDILLRTVEDLTVAVEIKSPVMLADHDVLLKARAATEAFGDRGIGYVLVDADGRTPNDIAKIEPSDSLKSILRECLRSSGKVTMDDLRMHLGQWPTKEISDQIQSLVLRHNLDYRVRLTPDPISGKLGRRYSFVLQLPTNRMK